MGLIKLNKTGQGVYECELDLGELYGAGSELLKFDRKWDDFLNSDEWNRKVFKRNGNIIKYSHKSWVPEKVDQRIPILIMAGNPAPQSVFEDIYYAYEINGSEHRFWKVLRKLGFIDLPFDLGSMKSNFFNLDYNSPFRIGIDVVLTFPSSASSAVWSGVQGLQKLLVLKRCKEYCYRRKVVCMIWLMSFLRILKGWLWQFRKMHIIYLLKIFIPWLKQLEENYHQIIV